MISSPSAQIVNALAEKIFVRDEGGPHVKAYGPVMGIATAIIAIGIAVTVALGPERVSYIFILCGWIEFKANDYVRLVADSTKLQFLDRARWQDTKRTWIA